jgi:hypothetical protein
MLRTSITDALRRGIANGMHRWACKRPSYTPGRPGTEGSVFALVTSLRAVGNACSGTLSAILTGAFGVSLEVSSERFSAV